MKKKLVLIEKMKSGKWQSGKLKKMSGDVEWGNEEK